MKARHHLQLKSSLNRVRTDSFRVNYHPTLYVNNLMNKVCAVLNDDCQPSKSHGFDCFISFLIIAFKNLVKEKDKFSKKN